MRLLIVDDNAAMRDLLRAMLRPSGFVVSEAASGPEALEALAHDGPWDAVITDLRMPAPSGLQVIAMARDAGLSTPFLLITAFPDEQVRATIARLPGTALLAKPFGRAELLPALTTLLPAR